MKKIIFISGIGKLHLIDAAIDLKTNKPDGVSILLMTSWIPGKLSQFLLKTAGKNKLLNRLKIRNDALQQLDCAQGLLLPELLYHALFKRIFSSEKALGYAFKLFGFLSAFRLLFICDRNTTLHLRSGAGFLAIKVARFKGAKVIVDHSIANPLVFESFFQNTPAKYTEGAGFNLDSTLWKQVNADCDAADALIVNSNFVKSTFITTHYPNPVYVNYLGVDELFINQHSKHYSESPKKLMFLGHFDVRKGADVLINVMTAFEKHKIPLELHVVGSVSESAKVIMSELGTPKSIVFHGFCSKNEVLALLLDSDVFIFPSYFEGCARAVMEALALGLAVIATKESGAPITENVDGIIINAGSVEDCYSAINELIVNPEKIERLGISAKELVKNNYSSQHYAERLLDIYKSV